MGNSQTELLINELSKESPETAKLSAINTLIALDLDGEIPKATVQDLAKNGQGYVQRFAKRLLE